MNFKTMPIKTSYETGTDDLVGDFYIPVLSETKYYDRLAGFFSSTSLAISSRGISGLVRNSGKIRLIASPRLSEADIEAIQRSENDPGYYLSLSMKNEILIIDSEFIEDHVRALGWMLANNYLAIKIALVCDQTGRYLTEKEISERGIFHQKVGIFKDKEGNEISFSGSINETASGWLKNSEEFKVFKRWIPGQDEYFEADLRKFKNLWEGKNDYVKVIDLPDAIRDQLIEKASIEAVEKLNMNYYRQRKSMIMDKLELFPFQKEAIKKWDDHGRRLIFEMATGTGKTRSALGCVDIVLREEKPIVIIIACPQNTLSRQWQNEIHKSQLRFDCELIADSTNVNWKSILIEKLLDISIGLIRNLVVFTTHDTSCSADFISILGKNKKAITYFFIGDEAHSLGATVNSRSLQGYYELRLGLSATPKRWYDDIGTEIIYEYFGDDPFEFSIKQALTTINPLTNKPFLCNYFYNPIFVNLSEEELNKYSELSLKVSKLSRFGLENQDRKKIFETLLFKRANIHKNAANKIPAFEQILDSIDVVEDLLIFVSPGQINSALRVLSKRGIVANKFTEKEGTTIEARFNGKSERQFLIEKFKERKIQALVAIKCLDEGIDIPSAKIAIILASSTNPREYIQRIGRVIRQSPQKSSSTIFDVVVSPRGINNHDELEKFERRVFLKEMDRAIEIAENALNNAEATRKIFNVLGGKQDEY